MTIYLLPEKICLLTSLIVRHSPKGLAGKRPSLLRVKKKKNYYGQGAHSPHPAYGPVHN